MSNKAFFEQEASFSGSYSREVLQSLWWAWSEWRLRIAVILVCGVVGRALLLSNTLVVGMWADSLCLGQPGCQEIPWPFNGFEHQHFVWTLLFLLGAGGLLSLAFTGLTSATGTRVAERYHNEAVMRLSRSSQSFFDKNPVGRIFARFSSDYQSLLMGIGPHLGQIGVIVLDLVLMSILIVATNVYFFPLLLFTAVLNYFVYLLNRMRIREERRASAAQRAPSIAKFSETVQGYLSIRLYGREQRFSDAFGETLDKYLMQKARADFSFYLFGFQMSSLTAILLLSSGVLGAWLIAKGHASIGQVGVVLTYVTLSSAFIQRLFTLVTSLEQGLTAAERLNQYLRMDIEPYAALPRKARYPTGHVRKPIDHVPRGISSSGGRLVVHDLWFRYGEDLPWVLQGVGFDIRPGEALGVIGRTGAGKSSLFQAILNLYPVARGKIEVDGLRLGAFPDLKPDELDLEEWRKRFAYIAQIPTIFKGSLRDNLDASAMVDDVRLLGILERVGLKAWLDTLPSGLDHQIEERGSNLSAGQKQLIATGRCLLSQSPVVLMDEATSAIDPNSEELFVKATTELLKDRTRLIIAHRLTTVAACDRILWLSNGKVRMIGDAEAVLCAFQKTDEAAAIEVDLFS